MLRIRHCRARCKLYKRRPGFRAEVLHQLAPALLDGADAQFKFPGDHLVGLAGHEAVEYLPLRRT